ncbi:Cutinase transcription factor 1 alpha [Sphaceloma murrayae]|uniref:Cutinase transcription factor 1 alpha n=1 Tax=Sphaceloma murrayae TaxID=2082308 RepID=A0A2K1QYG1_9PEZI|nr:Cutinase transcription factor 1 alpha [Sphaceloma murrayae]
MGEHEHAQAAGCATLPSLRLVLDENIIPNVQTSHLDKVYHDGFQTPGNSPLPTTLLATSSAADRESRRRLRNDHGQYQVQIELENRRLGWRGKPQSASNKKTAKVTKKVNGKSHEKKAVELAFEKAGNLRASAVHLALYRKICSDEPLNEDEMRIHRQNRAAALWHKASRDRFL